MKKLLIGILLMLLPTMAFAAKRAEVKQVTFGGVGGTGEVIATGNTVTSDSIYQTGNLGFLALATQVSGNVGITYQVSYDNNLWWTPNTTSSGSLTSAGTIATSITSNSWIVATAVLAPYMRFIYSSTALSTITADTLWQDES